MITGAASGIGRAAAIRIASESGNLALLDINFDMPQNANPDLIKTLIPLGKSILVSPEYVAGTIALLASDHAFHINGTEIVGDGGKVF